MYFQNTINVYSLFSHEWCVSLIKFMVGSTIHVRGRIHIYGTPGVLNNFLIFLRDMLRLQQFYNKSQVVSCYWFKFETNTKITFLP